MRVGRAGLAAMTALVLAGVTAPLPANAQKLPWADANPLERLLGKPAQPKRSHAKKRAVPTSEKSRAAPKVAAVPVPAARPVASTATAASAGAVEAVGATPPAGEDAVAARASAAAATPPVPAAAAVPKPEPSPASPDVTTPEPGDTKTPEATEAKPPIGADEPLPETPSAAKPADPAATAEKPVSEIPVPDKRPDDPAAEPAATPEPGAASVGVPAPAATAAVPPSAPAPADTAPNSTDKLKSRISVVSPAAAVLAAAAVGDAEACEAELTKRGVTFTVDDSISEGECGVLRPVAVTRLSSGIAVSPKTQMLCRTALALDDWMTAGVMPAAKANLPDRTLTEFRHASTYVCRPRASESGISEHARGSAIDIAAFVFDKGEEIGVAAKPAGTPEQKFQDAIRAAACGPFKTVLGPGTDADHTTHFHLDIAARNNGATYCK